ncbi:MAG: hypothetical protein WC637_11090 [Victivallales bacterium]|jgi:hypothetical protein
MKAVDFSLDLSANLAPPNHLWVNSGWGTVSPLWPTVCGVGECFSPPFAARGLKLLMNFKVDGHLLVDNGNHGKGDCGLLFSGGTWRPDFIERKGTYHHLIEGRLISVQVTSRLFPLVKRAGYLLSIAILNRSGRSIRIYTEPNIEPGSPSKVPLDKWTYCVPPPGAPAIGKKSGLWSNGESAIRLLMPETQINIGHSEEAILELAVIVGDEKECDVKNANLTLWKKEALDAWRNRMARASGNIPTLHSDIPGLEEYYRRSLISGLVCLWDRPDFATNPFLAVCGMDGGGVSAYPWDIGGYMPHSTVMLLGDAAEDLLNAMDNMGLDEFNQLTPSGSGAGRWYSYNCWSFINLAWALALQRELSKKFFSRLVKSFNRMDAKNVFCGNLVDYGYQFNLLEMRGIGWEHVVSSPNAERAWCMERLADMADFLKLSGGKEWRKQAKTIRMEIISALWNRKTKWFDSLYPDGRRETVYSIQAYDTLRMLGKDCPPEISTSLLSHLVEGKFLGTYGVSSVSAEDQTHYELNDPDWSGGGAYTGETPMLALTLWELGHHELAWDVLKRLFWMGKHLPYFPQEHYCDRPQVPAHKRANVCSGMSGVEAILFGLAGFSPQINGELWINPSPHVKGNISIGGFKFRGHAVDLTISNGKSEVKVDGTKIHAGKTRPLLALKSNC